MNHAYRTPVASVRPFSGLSFPGHRSVEERWQKRWGEKAKAASAAGDATSTAAAGDGDKETFYALPMFPYPSGARSNAATLVLSACIDVWDA